MPITVTQAAIHLRQPEALIKSALLLEAPLGSSISRVEELIRRHKWKLSYPLADTGFYDQRTRPPGVVGTQHLRASLGDYQSILLEANVTAFWGFDADGKLIDIWVWKTFDGP